MIDLFTLEPAGWIEPCRGAAEQPFLWYRSPQVQHYNTGSTCS